MALDAFGVVAYLEDRYPGIKRDCMKATLVVDSKDVPRLVVELYVDPERVQPVTVPDAKV